MEHTHELKATGGSKFEAEMNLQSERNRFVWGNSVKERNLRVSTKKLGKGCWQAYGILTYVNR